MQLTIFLLLFIIPNIVSQHYLLSSVCYYNSPLSATSIILSPSLPQQSHLLHIPLQSYLSLSFCHFNSSSSLFATAILSHPYATAILSLSLSFCHFNSCSPSLSLQSFLLPMPLQSYLSLFFSATSTLPLPSLSLQSYLLPMPLQYYLSLSFCQFISSSPLFATAILSPLYATAILSLFLSAISTLVPLFATTILSPLFASTTLLSLPLSLQLFAPYSAICCICNSCLKNLSP